ncbi:sialidase family protein [Rufibacter hautae]|uniref:Exo-alpha-sialidase n=1 Tax=Rufibacter hautae TaxID=2595005 RepID=A0A5B6TGQ5_9BACT|nr:sialidase family protein [Rufibacter hautae]KAA3438370.1 exo-alpha-sialidase [Rufibacter hautae]
MHFPYRLSILLFYFCLLSIVGCQSKAGQDLPQESRISQANLKASCPYLTKDHQGNPVLCWVQAQDTTGNYLLMYARSLDGGNTFEKPVAVPTSQGVYPHDENLSKILFKKNGDILAMFAVQNPNPDNSYAGLVKYTQSFDAGKTWTQPRQLAQDAENSIDERYFDITLLPTGEIAAIWLDSRKNTPKEGSSLYFSSTTNRDGFTYEKVIDQQLCQCCRTDLFVDGKGQLHAAYRAILNDSIRDMMHLVSADNGQTFAPRERISVDNWAIKGCPHTGPTLAWNQSGLHAAWYTMGGGSGVFYSHKSAADAFAPREAVSQLPSAKHPQLTCFGENQLALVWDEQIPSSKQFNSRIGLQIRNATGKPVQQTYLTADSSSATHPVVLGLSASKILVAYTQKQGEKSEVWYKVVETTPKKEL